MKNLKINKNSFSDVIIIGGGIVGSSIARSIALRYPNKNIKLIEKDSKLGQHNSILNSGVLHSGLYYPTNSNRAKYCVKGNKILTEYHRNNKIPLRECGKLIVAKNEHESQRLLKLYNQGLENGVKLELIDASRAIRIEPKLNLEGKEKFPVIFVSDTKVGSPKILIQKIEKDLKDLKNVEIVYNSSFKSNLSSKVFSTSSLQKNFIIKDSNDFYHESEYLINASGLYSDLIAKKFNTALEYDLLPIIVFYLVDKTSYYDRNSSLMNTLVYPVPPLQVSKEMTFLGVHTTITSEGLVKLGPTALPAFWREQHGGLNKFNINDFLKISQLYFKIMLSDKRRYFIKLLISQLKYLNNSYLVKDGSDLVTIFDDLNLERNYFKLNNFNIMKRFEKKTGGVRSQIINLNNYNLENDFMFLVQKNELHILNMISPGWTSAMAIAEDIKLEEKMI